MASSKRTEDGDHAWSHLHDEEYLLECNRTGVDFWDIKRKNVQYYPACGEEL